MTDPKKPADAEPEAPPDANQRWDDSGSFKTAADDPTAMWNEAALRAAGLTDIVGSNKPDSVPAPAATAPDVRGEDRARVVVARAGTPRPGAPAPVPAPAEEEGGGMSWGLTLGLAVGLAVGVYFLVRFLR